MNKDKNNDPLADIIQVWTSFMRDVLLVQQGKPASMVNIDYSKQLSDYAARFNREQVLALIQELMKCLELIEINANPRLMLDNLFLTMPAAN